MAHMPRISKDSRERRGVASVTEFRFGFIIFMDCRTRLEQQDNAPRARSPVDILNENPDVSARRKIVWRILTGEKFRRDLVNEFVMTILSLLEQCSES
jgi:hypothetical protein